MKSLDASRVMRSKLDWSYDELVASAFPLLLTLNYYLNQFLVVLKLSVVVAMFIYINRNVIINLN